MEAAAILMRKGISHSEIIEKTYYEKTYIQLQILAKALLESTMLPDEESVLSVIDRAMMLQYGLEPYDLEGIVSELRNIKGVEVAIFMYEQKTHQFKVSLRSKQKVDVSVIAKHFGGGGHKRAAGFSIFGTSDHIVPMIREQIRLQLDTGNETI
jgi:phosphoesterase RecJ-like protein